MPDADTDATVNAIMGGAFGSAGERCMALPVVVAVGDETADRLIERLKPLIAALRIGPGELRGKDENEMGPVVSRAHQQKVLGYIDKGVSEEQLWSWMAATIAWRDILKAFMSAALCLITSRLR